MPRTRKDEFDKIAPEFLKAKRAKHKWRPWDSRGIADTTDLRWILSSAEHAKLRAPNEPQSTWMKWIEEMKLMAEERGLPTEVFSDMPRTRDETPPHVIEGDWGDTEEIANEARKHLERKNRP